MLCQKAVLSMKDIENIKVQYLCMALFNFLLFCFVLRCYAFVQCCYLKSIQCNAMHKCVGVLDNPVIVTVVLTMSTVVLNMWLDIFCYCSFKCFFLACMFCKKKRNEHPLPNKYPSPTSTLPWATKSKSAPQLLNGIIMVYTFPTWWPIHFLYECP